jgi:hypothetical protein
VAIPALDTLLAPWASLYNHSKVLVTLVTFSHFAGLLAGGGAAVVSDRAALRAAGAGAGERDGHLRELRRTHPVVLGGLAVTILSGLLMLGADTETFLASKIFWAKMLLVGVLLANGALMVRAERAAPTAPARAWRALRATAVASLVLWFLALLAGTAMATLG